MFLYKNLSFSISSVISIPIMLIGINGGYFPAICRVCLKFPLFSDFMTVLMCSNCAYLPFLEFIKLQLNFMTLPLLAVIKY